MLKTKVKLKRPAPQPRRTERGEQRRLALLKTAQQVFLERGYEGASIEEIMRRVGGSKASLYSYFGSKEGLFFEILVAQTEAFMQELRIPETADDDLEKTLRRIGTTFLKVMLDEQRRGLFRIMIAETSRLPPELIQRFFDFGPHRGRKAFSRYLTLQRDAGRLRFDDGQRAASQFFELIKGQPHTRTLLGLAPFAEGGSLEQHVSDVIHLFLHGYASRS
ncbi:MAG: TetR/AcrR family transcriptional regulator [Nevskia sp.]|nr:TetR/AcrR family transcriptional regulator [Nevskia sp.]